MRCCAGARRGVRLDSPPVILHRGAMRSIGLAVAVAVSLTLAPLVAFAQRLSARVVRGTTTHTIRETK